ncbi:MAG: hypothetical protein LBQ52_04660 [Helicobacteraceae bacterium]|jgi:hypothetical protein|nr:hypothetical protein [Helicobacteraceae bacterium]
MAKKNNWRFWLFLCGAGLSCALAAIAAYLAIGQEIGTISGILIAGAALLPVALFGAPYINSKFYFSFSTKDGLKIGEEKRKIKLNVLNERREKNA